MSPVTTRFECAGCGRRMTWDAGGPEPFSCPAARPGDDIDHVVRPVLPATDWRVVHQDETNPFLRYRHRLTSYHLARDAGMDDATFCSLVRDLDAAVSRVDGRGFTVTTFEAHEPLGAALGLRGAGVWVKDETTNVSGSHKGRHLFGLLLHLKVAAWRAEGRAAPRSARLAIASCGNAALAAAVVARAAGLPLDVFVPPSASPEVVARLRDLGAGLTVCERRPGELGDPCYLRFREARDAGAIPFCCQGPDNGLTIEGGKTLAWEIVEVLGGRALDRVFLQVGGGAFASACAQAFGEAVLAGAMDTLPRIHAVQTLGGHPLARAYGALIERLLSSVPGRPSPGLGPPELADWAATVPKTLREAAIADAASHRSRFMRPWDPEPRSIAHGILDDETYDWLAIVRAMLESGGWPIVVSEDQLRRANDLGREATGSDVDHTGTAGLAGLLALLECTSPGGPGDARTERVAVVFTGARRGR